MKEYTQNNAGIADKVMKLHEGLMRVGFDDVAYHVAKHHIRMNELVEEALPRLRHVGSSLELGVESSVGFALIERDIDTLARAEEFRKEYYQRFILPYEVMLLHTIN